MARFQCAGPVVDQTCGAQVCRYDWASVPNDDETWDGYCAACRADRERVDELRGDLQRDESGA